MIKFIKILLIGMTIGLCSLSYADNIYSKFDVLKDDHNDDHEQHEKEEALALKKRLASLTHASRYACQLTSHFSQCREYPINKSLIHKLSGLKASCESLPGSEFKQGKCPSLDRIAQCKHIQLDYHDPQTLIYNNHYYAIGQQPWKSTDLKRVCQDLEGVLVAN